MRITIFAGRFGSGKTEIAVNYALKLVSEGDGVTLIDLDVITPYFRPREIMGPLREEGVEVVAPTAITQYVNLPAISPEILGALQREDQLVVLDVGGDEQGARALGQFSPYLKEAGYIMNLVVNPYRPFTNTVVGIGQAILDIEQGSRLKVAALVSNPNLIEETTLELVEEGHRLVEQASRDLGLPIAFIALEKELAKGVAEGDFRQPILPLVRHFYPPWA